MATCEIDSDLEEGEILDSDSCDDNSKIMKSDSTMSNESLTTKPKDVTPSDKTQTGDKESTAKNQQNSNGKPQGKDNSRTRPNYGESKFGNHVTKRKRSCDSENGAKNSKTDIKGKTDENNTKKDAFDIVREKAKSCPEESEPPRKMSKFDGKSNKPDFLPRKGQELCDDSGQILSKSGSNSTSSKTEIRQGYSSKTVNKNPIVLSSNKSGKIPDTLSHSSNNSENSNKIKDVQGQGEPDDFDTEDADVSSQTSELDDTLKESDSQKESSAYDYDMRDITESDTATDQQFTENSSPNTHEFEIIDDIGLDDEGGDSNPEDLSDEDLDDSEIYAWLEEGIDRKALNGDGSNEDGPIEREKVVLKGLFNICISVIPK